MHRRGRNVVIATLWTLATGVCAYLQNSPDALPWLQKKGFIASAINIPGTRDVLALATVIAASVGFYRTASCASNNEILQEQRKALLRRTKDSFAQTLALELGVKLTNGQTPELSVRIFLPERVHWLDPRALWAWMLHRNTLRFRISNVEGLADRRCTDGLTFVVSPSDGAQGLIGKCYSSKEIVLDDDLQNGNRAYNLSKQQWAATSDLVLCMCAPIFKKGDTRDTVIAIMALDSADALFRNAISRAKPAALDEVKVALSLYCKFLYKDIPDLFG